VVRFPAESLAGADGRLLAATPENAFRGRPFHRTFGLSSAPFAPLTARARAGTIHCIRIARRRPPAYPELVDMEGTMVTAYGWIAAAAMCVAVVSYEIDALVSLLQR